MEDSNNELVEENLNINKEMNSIGNTSLFSQDTTNYENKSESFSEKNNIEEIDFTDKTKKIKR